MSKPRNWYDGDEPRLYDHNGAPLHRSREPIGYQPNRWRTEMPNPNQKAKPSKTKKRGK